jgi:hypothetical protein
MGSRQVVLAQQKLRNLFSCVTLLRRQPLNMQQRALHTQQQLEYIGWHACFEYDFRLVCSGAFKSRLASF